MNAISRPYGMVLVYGPTSGPHDRCLSLYMCLSIS